MGAFSDGPIGYGCDEWHDEELLPANSILPRNIPDLSYYFEVCTGHVVAGKRAVIYTFPCFLISFN